MTMIKMTPKISDYDYISILNNNVIVINYDYAITITIVPKSESDPYLPPCKISKCCPKEHFANVC